ncbi:hypothetical protein H9Q08_03550 [Chryseobacterium sp. PS-8]|uniref:Uncharacterized protein n=1 Tax=Chryseobacterium indicum TaxID=2766954 RepID=A0ABS9C226_9FLAO|nr:hypothetical protein [Chryseobacterium sp. PS-8]MCF2218370.1 hypothetical protein [Chryseobacterium sp. PS-8]
METPELSGKEFENPLPRNVYKESWQGDDIFLLQDGLNQPTVTQNFIDCLSELDIKLNEKGRSLASSCSLDR